MAASKLRVWRLIPLLLFMVFLCPFASGEIIYVDDDAIGNNDGTSWENAYTFLQDALADAEAADKPVEIRVAQGVYKPNQRMPQTTGHGDNTFTLVNEVTVKGGYAGYGEPDPNTRDIETCETILSGDLNGDDIVVEDPCDMLLIESNRGDNSRVVVRANHTDATAVLDGFVITGGYFMDMYTDPPNGGAGMHIYQGSPTILNCTFNGNAAREIGGGLLNRGGSNPMLINCAFIGNYAESGGGIYNTPNIPAPWMISEGSHPTLVNCTFENNCAFKNGGGIYNFLSDPTLTDCTFRSNQVIGPYSGSTRGPYTGGGGGMYNSNSGPVLTNCQFSENSAVCGGGICNIADSNVTLTNCTFKDNSASAIGGGLSNLKNCRLTLTKCEFINNTVIGIGGGLANDSGNAMLVKCVFSGNQAHDWSMLGTSQVFSGLGGGMSTGSNSTLINCKFQLNYATEGAGMYLSGSPELIECIFTGNSATEDGGGIQNVGTSSEPVITNCIFSGNSANRGGGIFFTWGARMIMANCMFAGNFASIGKTLASEPTKPSLPGYINLINCILWDGDNAIFDPEPYALRFAITYSNVQGGWPGEGNINADPCFADPGYWADVNDPNIIVDSDDPNAVWVDGDYHLKSQAGRWDPNSESWIQDDVTSPCIDAGNPDMPVGDEPMQNGGIINIGIYGGTREASKSYILSKVIYVDDDAVGLNDGTNWENAYTFLQDALADAKSAIKRVEIRVAQGVYKPKLETGYRIPGTNITGSYLSRFQLINGVTLLGGYAGLTEMDPDIRDVEKYETILSGDLNGDDVDVINPRDLFDEPTRLDNCSSIVIGSGTNRTAVLDGFIITGGRIRVHPAVIDSPTGIGGGMKNYYGSPTINNCTFTGNSAEGGGGGIGHMYDSSPIITNCKFINNYGGRGGGFYNVNSNPTFINCTFTNNYADDGAGMSSSYWSIWEPAQATDTKLNNCIFEDNNAKSSGGGLYVYKDEAVLTNCTFIGNSASKGGGTYSGSGNPMLTYCLFISNSASEGGGVYNDSGIPKLSNCQFIRNNAQVTGGGLYSDYDANPLLTNCIFIDNSSNRCGGGLAGNNSIYNCIISGNTAVHNGGAIYGWGEIMNCTVIGNKASGNGGGICTQGIITLVNSIVHSNNALIGDEIYLGLRIVPAGRGGTKEGTPSVMVISYSNVLGGEEEVPLDTDCTLIWESGNIDIDPLFVEPGYWDSNSTPDDFSDDIWIEGDYHLKSQAGRWDPNSQSWVVDNEMSPCIDAGDPNSPIGNEPFPNGGVINMGAYGGTEQASLSLSTVHVVP